MVSLRALDRKLLRDLLRIRLQVVAIALLVACGVSVAVMAFSAQEALRTAQSRYYAQARFADVFATARRAPLFVAETIRMLPGVTAADPRAASGGLMQVPGLLRPATAQLIALPDDHRRALNRLVLVQGRMPDPARLDEAVALQPFLEAAHVRLGQRLSMIIDGREVSFSIVGAVLSPEFAYAPGSASALPDDAHHGVLWAPRQAVERASGLGGAFSTIALKLAPGASTPETLTVVDRLLAPYGGIPAIARADQVSNKFQDDHIRQFGVVAWVIPPIFLVVAAGLVHLMFGRIVDAQREQVGLLKAFGYSDLAAAGTYLKMAAVIGLIGAAAGGLFGAWLGGAITSLMGRYVRFPVLDLQFSWRAFGLSSAISVGAAMTGSLLAVRRAAAISPAIAMQPPAPAAYRRGWMESQRLWKRLDEPTRMILRNLERYPARAGLTLAGLALSLSLLVGSQFMFGSLDEIVDQAYFRARQWSEVIGFAERRDARAVAEAARLPGVIAAEPMRVAPVRMEAGGHVERAALMGFDPDARLNRALDARDRTIPLEGRGLILSDQLASRLGVRAGDFVQVEITEGRRPRASLPVTATAQDYSGLAAFIDRTALNRLMGEGDLASGASLMVADDRRPEFYRALARTPQIVSATSRADTVGAFRTTVIETLNVEMVFYLGFAAAIAFGVAYNIGRIALADRARDLATLRVLGFGQRECAYILAGELLFLALLAIPLGVGGGRAIAVGLATAFQHEDLRLPIIITARSYGVALAIYFCVVALAAGLVVQRIWSFDLVSVLKTRE